MTTERIAIVAVCLAAYQLYVTLRVLFAVQYSKRQRALQAAIIWLVPLFGALVCHLFLANDGKPPRPRDTGFTEAPENPPGAGQHGL